MSVSIDDLIPPEPAVLTPSVRREEDGRLMLTVIAGGRHRRLILADDHVASLLADLARIVLGENKR